jgi:hypothetical protein
VFEMLRPAGVLLGIGVLCFVAGGMLFSRADA